MYTGPKIVTDGLIFGVDPGSKRCYPGSGTSYTDLIDNSRTGTLAGGNISYSTDHGGIFNNSGVGYLIVDSSLADQLNGQDEATLEMYLRLNLPVNSSGEAGLIQLSGYNDTNGTLYFYSSSANYIDIFRTARWTAGHPGIDPTIWHQFYITSKIGTDGYRMGWNGVLFKSITGATISVDASISGGLTIGENSVGRDVRGSYGITRIYNRALTDAEILSNYNATIQRYK